MAPKLGLMSYKKNMNLGHSRAKRLRPHTEAGKELTRRWTR